MTICVRDLRNRILYCRFCGAEYNTNTDDYWDKKPDYIFICCEEPMRLVVKHTVYKEVTNDDV